MDLLSQGNTAFVDEDFEAALSLYTKVCRWSQKAHIANRLSDPMLCRP